MTDFEEGDAPEETARAWDEEIARRVAKMEAGRTEWIGVDEVLRNLRRKIEAARS